MRVQQRRLATASIAAAILIGGAVVAANVTSQPAAREVAAPQAIASTVESVSPSAPPSLSPSVAPSATAKSPAPRQTSKAASRSRPRTESVASSGSCGASFYDEPQMTANGETFNPDALTAASKTLAFNTRVRVTSVDTGKSVIVRINDRGPYISGRCLDLSRAAFAAIDSVGKGEVTVKYEVLR